jgi:hypothetical protein
MPFDKEGKPVPGLLSHDYVNDLIDTTGKGPKNYLQVKHKLPMARELWPEAEITTELLHYKPITGMETRQMRRRDGGIYDKDFYIGGLAVVRATVKLPNGAIGVGHKQETSEDFLDYLEKAETGAIGRALSAVGIGVEFSAEDYEYERDSEKPYKGVITPGTPADDHAPNLTLGLDLPLNTQRVILMEQIAAAAEDVIRWRDLYKATRYAAEQSASVDAETGEVQENPQSWRFELIAAAAPTLDVLEAIDKCAHAVNAKTVEVNTAIVKKRKALAKLPAADGAVATA